MDKELINAQAFGTLHKGLIIFLYEQILNLQAERSNNHEDDTQVLKIKEAKINRLCRIMEAYLDETEYLEDSLSTEQIRLASKRHAEVFFRDMTHHLIAPAWIENEKD